MIKLSKFDLNNPQSLAAYEKESLISHSDEDLSSCSLSYSSINEDNNIFLENMETEKL